MGQLTPFAPMWGRPWSRPHRQTDGLTSISRRDSDSDTQQCQHGQRQRCRRHSDVTWHRSRHSDVTPRQATVLNLTEHVYICFWKDSVHSCMRAICLRSYRGLRWSVQAPIGDDQLCVSAYTVRQKLCNKLLAAIIVSNARRFLYDCCDQKQFAHTPVFVMNFRYIFICPYYVLVSDKLFSD